MPRVIPYTLNHNAEAKALHGKLTLPLVHTIESQAFSMLNPLGGYLAQHTAGFRAHGIVSYEAAHTQVSGNRDSKPGKGWTTISTSVVEYLNILEVVTADRVVSQVFTEHHLDGYVPSVSFLGTRIDNLRIAGVPVNLTYDTNFVGPLPAAGLPYTRDKKFMARARAWNRTISSSPAMPSDVQNFYKPYSLGAVRSQKDCETMLGSVVKQATGAFPGTSVGHVISIPHFGTIHLGTLSVSNEDFKNGVPHKTTFGLTMISAWMGCLASGQVDVAVAKTNGGKKP